MKQITVMLLAPERARADVMFCADRAYYHFATEDTVEDGDLPGLGDETEAFGQQILTALEPRPEETPLAQADDTLPLNVRVFVDNVERKFNGAVTEEALRRFASLMSEHNDALGFFKFFSPC